MEENARRFRTGGGDCWYFARALHARSRGFPDDGDHPVYHESRARRILCATHSRAAHDLPDEYFLYVFAVAVGAMGNIVQIFNSAGMYFVYVALVLFGSFLLHAALCALFNIDVDTMLIVSVSAICSPPFVGVAAVSIKARKLILPGITTGIIGYAAGNYLGIALAEALKALGG